jgi:hypothetical protein
MNRYNQTALIIALLGFSSPNTELPQTPLGPFAHWTGTISARFGEVKIEIELAKDETAN